MPCRHVTPSATPCDYSFVHHHHSEQCMASMMTTLSWHSPQGYAVLAPRSVPLLAPRSVLPLERQWVPRLVQVWGMALRCTACVSTVGKGHQKRAQQQSVAYVPLFHRHMFLCRPTNYPKRPYSRHIRACYRYSVPSYVNRACRQRVHEPVRAESVS